MSRINGWATPNTMDGLPPKSPEALNREMTIARPGRSKPSNLRDQVSNMQNWVTPTSMDANPRSVKNAELYETGSGSMRRKNENGTTSNIGLANQVKNWPTPASRDWKGGRKLDTLEESGRNENNSLPDKVNAKNGDTGALNPDWVERLMGWPIGWSNIEPIDKLEFDADWSEWERDDIPRVTKNATNRANRLKAIGNGQVPLTCATAYRMLENYND